MRTKLGMKRRSSLGVSLVLSPLLLLAAACGSQDAASQQTEAGNDAEASKTPAAVIDKPTELTVYHPWGLTHEIFMEREGGRIVKKYPNLSFKVLNSTNGTLDKLILTNEKIDIIYATEDNYLGYKNAGFISDMSDLMKKYNTNFNGIDSGVMNYLKTLWSGQMYGLPVSAQTTAMYHNKDIFDKFGVPYPTDSMTWDDAYNLAARLTRQDGGITYRGFASRTIGSNDFRYNQLSLPLVDPETGKAVYNTDAWKSYVQNFVRFYQVPGYGLTPEIAAFPKSVDLFVKERTLAMILWTSSDFNSMPKDLNWAASALPSFREKPGVGQQYQTIVWYLSDVTPNREEAFLAMAEAVSSETQLAMSRIGQMSILTDPSVRKAFGEALPGMEGRNFQSIIPKQPAEKPVDHKYTANILSHLYGAFDAVRSGEKDINTAFREAEEKTNQWMAQKLASEAK